MVTAVYPDDARLDVNNFSIIGTVQYNNTGSSLSFQLPSAAATVGEVMPIADGVIQNPSTYYLTQYNGSLYANIDFQIAPAASNLTIKTIRLPSAFLVKRSSVATYIVEYSNSAVTTVHGNNYVVNGVRTTYALPAQSFTSQKDSMLISVSGVTQSIDDYTFPSTTLGNMGIDLLSAPTISDTVVVRVFNTGATIYDRKQSIADRKVDRGFTYDKEIPVKTTKFIVPYEKRRLISRKFKRTWDFSYTNITGLEKEAIETFYDARSGTYQAFSFDLTHLNEVGTAIVCFESSPRFTHTMSGEVGDLYKNFWTVNIKFKEVDD